MNNISTVVELFLILFLIAMLIIVPISMVKVVLTLRRLKRERKNLYKTIFIPYMREENNGNGFGKDNGNGFRLDEKQVEFMESLLFGKGFEFRPRFFRAKTKRRFSKAGLVVGLSLLAYILFRLVDLVANWVVVSYF